MSNKGSPVFHTKLVLGGNVNYATSPEQRLRSSRAKDVKSRLMEFLAEHDKAKATDANVENLAQNSLDELNAQLVAQYGSNLDTFALEREMRGDVRALMKPLLFMNLACLLQVDDKTPKSLGEAIFFVCSGRVLGTVGPRQVQLDALCQHVAQGLNPIPLTVADVMRLVEFVLVKQDEVVRETLTQQVDALRPHAAERVGVALQRPSSAKRGGFTFSFGDQSVIIGQHILFILEAPENLHDTGFLDLVRLLQQISTLAKFAVIALFQPQADDLILDALHEVLVYNEEGLAYFGPVVWLRSFCSLAGYNLPRSKAALPHLVEAMGQYAPSQFEANSNNTNTPFTARYKYSALGKTVIDVINSGPQDGGNLRASPKSSLLNRVIAKALGDEEKVMGSAELKRRKAQPVPLQDI